MWNVVVKRVYNANIISYGGFAPMPSFVCQHRLRYDSVHPSAVTESARDDVRG